MDQPRRAIVPLPLRFLPTFLFERDTNLSRYILRAWLWSVLPAMALTVAGKLLLPADGAADELNADALKFIALYAMLVAPVLETIVMLVPLLLLVRLAGPGWAALCSGLLWGAAHWAVGPQLGPPQAWSFTLMSVVLITWRPAGLLKAMAIVAAVHALHNSVTAAGLLIIVLLE